VRRVPLLLGSAAAVAALIAGLAYASSDHTAPGTKPSPPANRAVTIPGAGGTQLAAYLIQSAGPGEHPLLVMPASWGSGADEYLTVGRRLAAKGYIVLSYAQRGFGGSQGKIDFAGDDTQADVSRVISWALAHTAADPKAIGAVGVSYGAGIALLAAEKDPRIRAVVAMSAWSDLGESLYPGSTPSQQAVYSLFASGTTRRRLDGDIGRFATEFLDRQPIAAALSMVPLVASRSPATGVARLNKNHPAVMIANDYEDSYFPPSQLVTLFDELTVPKRLQLSIGDHGGAEAPGLAGNSAQVWTDAAAWLDHYLRGTANGIQPEGTVQLEDVRTGLVHSYSSWTAATGKGTAYYLGAANGDGAADGIASAAATGWRTTIDVGEKSTADSPPIQLGKGSQYRLAGGVPIAGISRTAAAVWEGQAGSAQRLVVGSPTVHLTVTPSATSTTLIAYLYDVDASGAGTLMTYQPYSLVRVPAGAPTSVDIALQPIAWTLPAGHRLSLVIDTVDWRYQSLNTPGSTATFTSPRGDPATLSVPIG
jgi:putative CocE/NonD family hydrolase